MNMLKKFAILVSLSLCFLSACEQKPSAKGVQFTDAWVRATAPGAEVGAAYVTLTSAQASTLIGVDAEVADSAEIHSMTMENGVMKMRALENLTLNPNKPEKLAPGGFHLMLFGLKAPLEAGKSVAFTFCFKDAQGNVSHQTMTMPIKAAE